MGQKMSDIRPSKRNNTSQNTPELISIPDWDLILENVMQTDLVPELPPSGGYENTIRVNDVFSRYAFAYPVSSPTAVNTAKVTNDNVTRLAYLPTVKITDNGSVFCLNCDRRKSPRPGHHTPPCNYEAGTNYWSLRKNACYEKDVIEHVLWKFRNRGHKNLPLTILN